MEKIKIMIVEDDEQDLQSCRDCVKDFEEANKIKIELIECKSVDEAFQSINNTIDGAIIDLKLSDEGNEGDHIIEHIEMLNLRIPIAILTGTPYVADDRFAYIGVFKKGDIGAGYEDMLSRFWDIHKTGLSQIMGGRGKIETTLQAVFHRNILPQLDKWIEYGCDDPNQTERALLRHTLNHLLELLNEEEDRTYPEEMYICPPINKNLQTGSIIKEKYGGKSFVVLNPSCDLVVRKKGNCKTNRILIVAIEDDHATIQHALNGVKKEQKRRDKLETLCKNSYSLYYHWLPKTNFFEGGFINFRKISTNSLDEIKENFEIPKIQISSPFIKDIVARFSSYYARQGQPDIYFGSLINEMLA